MVKNLRENPQIHEKIRVLNKLKLFKVNGFNMQICIDEFDLEGRKIHILIVTVAWGRVQRIDG
jgi:hypothetical protein